MAAATQVPSGSWPSISFWKELAEALQKGSDLGCFATSDTVATALTNIANELTKR